LKGRSRLTLETIPKLVAIARNTFGCSTHARGITLDGTVGAYVRYASAAWSHCLQYNLEKKINQIHRAMLLLYLPATVICGWMPLKYTVVIRTEMYKMKKKKKKKIHLEKGSILRTSHMTGLPQAMSCMKPCTEKRYSCGNLNGTTRPKACGPSTL